MTKVYQDLRSFLDTLEEEGQLLHVTDEVLARARRVFCLSCCCPYAKRSCRDVR